MRKAAGCLFLVLVQTLALGQHPPAPAPWAAQQLTTSLPDTRATHAAAPPPSSPAPVAPPPLLPPPLPGPPPPVPGEKPFCAIPPCATPAILPPLDPAAFAASSAALQAALDELRATRQHLEKDRADAQRQRDPGPIDEAGRLQLRVRLAELVRRIGERPKAVAQAQPAPEQPILAGKVTPPVGEAPPPVDPLDLPQSLYRAARYEDALAALKALKRDDFSRRDQIWISYLSAGCLRQMGKRKEAAVIYREVAAREDAFLAEMATWNLSVLSWRDEVESSIERLKGGKP